MSVETKKRGRPKKGTVEDNNFSQDNSTQDMNNDIPENNGVNEGSNDQDADLKSFLKKDKKKSEPSIDSNFSQNDVDEEMLSEIEDFESKEGLNDIPSDDYNPLDEPVKQRDYTGGMNNQNQNQNTNTNTNTNPNQQEKIIEEPNYKSNGSNKLDVDDNLMNPTSNDIPNDKSNGGGGDNKKSDNQNTSSSNSEGDKAKKQESDNLKELTNKEKKESIEKTADAILLAYKNYIPLPFVYFASHDTKKLEKLHDTDVINLETEVRRDGTTFREYAKEFNKNVDKAFEVTDAEVEALKDPLVDVLMEQEFAFTPTQRLMFVGGQFLVAKVMMCVKFLREKKSDIQEMKDIHAEKMEEMRKQYERGQRKTPQPQQETRQSPNVTVTEKKKEEPESEEKDNSVTDAEIISETKNEPKTELTVVPTLDEALDAEEDNDQNDSEESDETNDIPQ